MASLKPRSCRFYEHAATCLGQTPVRDTMTTTRCLSVAAILCGFLGCAPVAAAPIVTGRQVIDINGAPMVVFTYRPGGCSDPALLMVFHGVARNARTYRDDARDRGPPLPARRRAGVRQTRLSRLALPARRHRQGRGGAGCARLVRQAGARSRRLGAGAGRAAARLFSARPVFPSLEVDAPYGLGKVYSGANGEAA